MDPSDNIRLAVSVMTAIMSGQDEIAYEIVEENDAVAVISALVGMSMSCLSSLSIVTGVPAEIYLQQLGKIAIKK